MRSTLAPSARAAAGARQMDQYNPQWYLIVEPTKLNIDHPNLCILGQVDSCFCCSPALPWALGDAGVDRWAIEHGFVSQPTLGEEDDQDDPGDREELERAWRHEITSRRLLAPLADALLAEASS